MILQGIICVMIALIRISSSASPSKTPSSSGGRNVTTSGIFAGATMASQMHVIWSEFIEGVAIFAGHPYYCAQGSFATAIECMINPTKIDVNKLIQQTDTYANNSEVDSTSNLAGDKVYIYSGSNDLRTTLESVLRLEAGRKVEKYYGHFEANISTEFNVSAKPAQPAGARCRFIGDEEFLSCNYIGAWHALGWLYGGNLLPPVPATGVFSTFDQSKYFENSQPIDHSMDNEGFLYIPTGCASGLAPCKLHMVFHGCKQQKSVFGENFARNIGYLEVAEANDIILIFPQTVETPINPEGCWDWWGYTGEGYATQAGNQTKALKEMLRAFMES